MRLVGVADGVALEATVVVVEADVALVVTVADAVADVDLVTVVADVVDAVGLETVVDVVVDVDAVHLIPVLAALFTRTAAKRRSLSKCLDSSTIFSHLCSCIS